MTFKMGNIPVRKLSDTVAACNLIRNQRRDNKKRKSKSIRIDFDNDEDLSIATKLQYYMSTGHISITHCLQYHSLAFYPMTNQKLRCTNPHALKRLYHRRTYQREYRRNKRKGDRL